jgi:hypothetical protein
LTLKAKKIIREAKREEEKVERVDSSAKCMLPAHSNKWKRKNRSGKEKIEVYKMSIRADRERSG